MIQKLVDRYRHDPVLFVKEMFDAEPEPEQIEMLNSVNENRMTTVKAGHGVGKTTTLAWVVLWFMFTRPFPKVPCTAPTMHQLRDILWAEISKWLSKSTVLKELFYWTVERLALARNEEKWFAVARTATKPDAMQGFHSESLLFVLDEASGINDIIFEPILGALTGEETKLIMVGNPTKTSGFFYDSFTKNRSMFHCITLNAEHSKRVTHDFVNSIIALYGKDSDPYRVRVLGEFPKSQADTFISLELIERATILPPSIQPDDVYEISLGVDVARYGDDESIIISDIYTGKKHIAKIEDILYKNSTVELTGHVKQIIRKYNELYPKIAVQVNVDGGGVGAGVVDELDNDYSDLKYIVNEKTFGGSGGSLADEPMQYSNDTGIMWGNIKRLLMNEELIIPDDAELITQLSNRKYKIDEDGKILLERKADMKKRGAHSPDRADALALALSTHTSQYVGFF